MDTKKPLTLALTLLTGAMATLHSDPAISAPKQTKTDRYATARSELPEDLYPVYRYLERIMQFNKTDQTIGIAVRSSMSPEECLHILSNKELCAQYDLPDVSKKDSMALWAMQVVMSTSSNPNATADSQQSLIRMGKPLLSGLSGKPIAVACVVGHELAHITQNHTKKRAEKNTSLDKVYSEKVSSAVANAHKAQRSQQFWNAMAVGLNAFSAGLNSSQGNYFEAAQAERNSAMIITSMQADQANAAPAFQYLVANMQNLRLSAPQTMTALQEMEGLGGKLIMRTKRDTDQYFSEWKKDLMQYTREQELEADRIGVEYVAKAGLDPSSCLETIDFIHKRTGDTSTKEMSSHPGESERRASMEEAINELPMRLKRMHTMKLPTVPMLPYIYDSETQIIRISPPGTPGLTPGKNNKSDTVDGLLGL